MGYTFPDMESENNRDAASASVETSWQPEDQRGAWQIVPPIVTGPRVPVVRPGVVAPEAPQGRQLQFRQAASTGSQQRDMPLFRVSFAGPDQQWYRISATVEQRQNALPDERTEDALPMTGPLRQAYAPVRPAQQPGQPFWLEEEEVGQQGSLRLTDTPPAGPTWGQLRENWQQGVRPVAAPTRQTSPLGQQRATWQETPVEEEAKADETDKNFVLQVIQPGLAGLMDGSVSTLAPIFAVAFATHRPFTVFLVGMASALGAGISMTFSEALSDDGEITGRGKPFVRGGVTGLMTFVSGAGHALPFLIPNIQIGLFVAYGVVVLELLGIAAIRHKFFGTKWWLSIVQVVGGGLLVFLAALLLGNA